MKGRTMLLVNPKARTRRKPAAKRRTPARRRTVARASNPAPARRRRSPVRRKRAVTRRKSNPSARSVVDKNLMPSLIGATGALGLDVSMGYVNRYLPADMQTPMIGNAVKAATALLGGMVLQKLKLVKPSTAQTMVNGALTVTIHDVMKLQFGEYFPSVPMGKYVSMGKYVGSGPRSLATKGGRSMNGLGYSGAGQVVSMHSGSREGAAELSGMR